MNTPGLPMLQCYARYFPISRGKQRVISTLWKSLSLGNYEHETTLVNSRVRVKCDLTKMIQRQLYFMGSYESEYCQHWINLARKAHTIFDIGANVGLYSLLAAEANPSADIHAFEPTPEIVEILSSNIRLNDFKNIRINTAGVGSQSGRAVLRECKGYDGNNEGMNYLVNSIEVGESSDRVVPVVSIQDYCQEHAIDRIDLLKMDIEGGEYDALSGARSLLESKSISCLFIEITEWAAKRSGHSTVDIVSMLRDLAYQIYRLRPDGLHEIGGETIPEGENVIAFASSDFGPLALRSNGSFRGLGT